MDDNGDREAKNNRRRVEEARNVWLKQERAALNKKVHTYTMMRFLILASYITNFVLLSRISGHGNSAKERVRSDRG